MQDFFTHLALKSLYLLRNLMMDLAGYKAILLIIEVLFFIQAENQNNCYVKHKIQNHLYVNR